MDKSEEKGSNFGKGLLKAGGIAAAGIAATTAAVGAGAKAFVSGVSSVAQYGDNIDKMSQKMNMSAEAFQEWSFIMEHSGTSIESMQASIKTLSNAAETGSEAFEQLGISQEQIASMSGEELFSSVITALQEVDDETERTYLAGKLLGRGATELGALLNTSAEDTEAMRKQVHELGGVMSDEAVKNAASFQDSLQNMQVSFSGVKNSILSNFLPSLTTAMDGLSAIFSGDSKGGLGKLQDGISKLASEITKQAPMFVSVAGTIISALVSGISQNLPALLSSGLSAVKEIGLGIVENLPLLLQAGMDVIGEIVSALVDNAPLLIQTGLTLILTLATGIGESAPDLIPAIVDVILLIVEKLTEPNTVMQLVNAAIVLIGGIATGIIRAIPSIVKTIPVLVKNLVTSITQNFPQIVSTLFSLLGDLFTEVVSAISEAMGTDLQTVGDGLRAIGDTILNAFNNIKTWFSDLGTNLSHKVADIWTNLKTKFSDGLNAVKTLVTSSLDAVKEKFTSIFDGLKNIVTTAIEAIKGAFNFEWHLPELKIPHISVKGGEPPYGLGGKGSLPSFDVQWYRKAYDDAYILNRATIFGATGGTLLGGGEGTGSEAIVGTNLLKNMMRDVLNEHGTG
ncbi:MAG: hypothetical protein IKS77_01745, partial [Spirochaetales bacterium]|nr:hypothetical protein [Spirochaetales bacterium]